MKLGLTGCKDRENIPQRIEDRAALQFEALLGHSQGRVWQSIAEGKMSIMFHATGLH